MLIYIIMTHRDPSPPPWPFLSPLPIKYILMLKNITYIVLHEARLTYSMNMIGMCHLSLPNYLRWAFDMLRKRRHILSMVSEEILEICLHQFLVILGIVPLF